MKLWCIEDQKNNRKNLWYWDCTLVYNKNKMKMIEDAVVSTLTPGQGPSVSEWIFSSVDLSGRLYICGLCLTHITSSTKHTMLMETTMAKFNQTWGLSYFLPWTFSSNNQGVRCCLLGKQMSAAGPRGHGQQQLRISTSSGRVTSRSSELRKDTTLCLCLSTSNPPQ